MPRAPGVYQHVTPRGGWPLPSPGDLPDPGIESLSPPSPELEGRFFSTSATWEAPGLRQTPRKTGNFCKEESVLPSWKQEGPGFLDDPSPSFISTAIICRMALRTWKRTPIRLGRGLQGSAAWSSTLLFQSWASQTTFLGPQFPHQ